MPTTEAPHVLVIGDDVDAATSMCRTLSEARFRCTRAASVGDAVAMARESGVDAALLDVSRCGSRERLALTKRLSDEREDLGIVLVAGTRSLEDLVDALRSGVVDYLSKPLASGELAEAVARAVEWGVAAKRSRVTHARYEREMADEAARLGALLVEADIASSRALDAVLERLYEGDAATLDHVRRVASATVLIAEGLAVAEPLRGDFERAALLHDLGKLAIPRAVVRKPWARTEGELTLVRSHAAAAARVLEGIPFLAPTAAIVRSVREHFDGRGYPDGLRGAQIPLGARIITVAEVFDTLGGGRALLTPGTLDTANAELVRGAGTRFDPLVINAWLRCLDKFGPSTYGKTPS